MVWRSMRLLRVSLLLSTIYLVQSNTSRVPADYLLFPHFILMFATKQKLNTTLVKANLMSLPEKA